eukprot:5149654-Amphidinium_carterae.2
MAVTFITELQVISLGRLRTSLARKPCFFKCIAASRSSIGKPASMCFASRLLTWHAFSRYDKLSSVLQHVSLFCEALQFMRMNLA